MLKGKPGPQSFRQSVQSPFFGLNASAISDRDMTHVSLATSIAGTLMSAKLQTAATALQWTLRLVSEVKGATIRAACNFSTLRGPPAMMELVRRSTKTPGPLKVLNEQLSEAELLKRAARRSRFHIGYAHRAC